ncbi:MAG: ATP-binding protein [Parachlamydia sp.]|nr:ATP-binding protein [Parachlamydia sp.]
MRRIFLASLDELHAMLAFIRECAIAAGFDAQIITRLELACEEALVNIISYAYPSSKGSIHILCKPADPSGLTIEIRDQGIPYDPLTFQASHGKELGGYGIALIRNLMDQVIYKRDNQDNVLTLIKYLDQRDSNHG